jgi:hypothetical protein
MLAENAARRLYLNSWEREFLPNIAAWVGALTEQQESVFQKVLAAVARRPGGRKPPS